MKRGWEGGSKEEAEGERREGVRRVGVRREGERRGEVRREGERRGEVRGEGVRTEGEKKREELEREWRTGN